MAMWVICIHYTFTPKIITNIYIGIVDYFEFKV